MSERVFFLIIRGKSNDAIKNHNATARFRIIKSDYITASLGGCLGE